MPSKNSIKSYVENGYYHLYNRGVEKRIIFLDQQDYGVFLSYLKEYLVPKNEKELHEKLSNPNTSYKEKDKY
jgi:putative transposase